MKTPENEDKDMMTLNVGSTGKFVRGGNGNLDQDPIEFNMVYKNAKDCKREQDFREYIEYLRERYCGDCDEFGVTCHACEQASGFDDFRQEVEPIDFTVVVKRSMPRNANGTLAWHLLPLFS